MASSPPTGIQALPLEVLAMVLGHLGAHAPFSSLRSYADTKLLMFTIPKVCKQWRAACKLVPAGVAINTDALTDAGLLKLVGQFPAARSVTLFGGYERGKINKELTREGLAAMACWPGVCRLNLSGVGQRTDELLHALAACPRVEHLAICGNPFVRGGYRGAGTITDAVLAGLVGRLPKLQLLSLRRCLTVTDGGVEAVAAGCPKLHHLDLTGCEDVTDDGVAAVAAGCPKLRHLNLYDCMNVTDGGLEAVAAGCHDLQHLDLTGCEEVTDDGLEAVAAGCPDLQYLNLTGCDSVTFRGTALFRNAELIDCIWC